VAEAPVRIDAQPVEPAAAWRRGQAVIADMPLSDAVGEMNRYGVLASSLPMPGSLR
jgi:transmembrane sensor